MPKMVEAKFEQYVMAESAMAAGWKVNEAPRKVAALMPLMPTSHLLFTLGPCNLIWYKDEMLRCTDRCLMKAQMRFPNPRDGDSQVGVIGFKFKSPSE